MAAEQEISLGGYLRHEREQRCITIEQVASATKVGVRTLHALEEDHYAELPAKPFIRGFVISYCRFIGLDPKETLARFDLYIDRKGEERPNRESGHSGYAFEKKDGEQQGRTLLMISIFSFIVLGGLAMFFLKPSLRYHRSSHVDKLRAAHGNDSHSPSSISGTPSPIVAVLQGATNPSPSPSPSPLIPISGVVSVPTEKMKNPEKSEVKVEKESGSAEPSSVESPGVKVVGANPLDPLDSGHELPLGEVRHRVIFKMLGDVWVRFQVDQRPIRKFIVRKGKSLVLRGKDSVRIQVSDPNSLEMSYNGEKSELMSKSKHTVVQKNDASLFFSSEVSRSLVDSFTHEKPLPKMVDLPISKSTPNE